MGSVTVGNLPYQSSRQDAQFSYLGNRLTDVENRLAVAKGQGWTWSLGLADANYYI